MKVKIVDVNIVDEKVKVKLENGRVKIVDMSGCWRCEERGCLGDVNMGDGRVIGMMMEVEKLCKLLE